MTKRLEYPVSAMVICLAVLTAAYGEPRLTADEAKDHIGETATVCGLVTSAKYAAASHRSPTFLNLERPYPQHVFTIVIWGDDRPKFGAPEAIYSGRRVCVTGEIQQHRGKPEIIATHPSQLHSDHALGRVGHSLELKP
jgi:hypothetical protein